MTGRVGVLTTCLVAILFVLIGDLYSPYGMAGVPYVAVVLIALWSPNRWDVILVAAVCVVLVGIGAYFGSAERLTFEVIFNRVVAGSVIAATTLIGLRRKSMEEQLAAVNQQLEQLIQDRTAERDLAEVALRDHELFTQSLVNGLPLNLFRKDLEGRIIFANQRFCEDVGLSLEEVVGKTDLDLFDPGLAKKYREDDQKVVEGGRSLEVIEEHPNADGEKMYVQVMKAPVKDSQGATVGTQGMFWDATDRVRAEQAQMEADSRYRRLVSANIIGIITANFDGRVLDANDAFLKMLGFSHSDLEEELVRWDNLTPADYWDQDQQVIRELKETGQCQPFEKEFVRKDGRHVPVLLGVTMLEGSAEECICFVLDISERKRAEVQLRAAKEAADAASIAKSRFLANMSHEVRTPLNAVLGLTELLQGTSLSPEQKEYVELVHQSGESLLLLINDVLDFSKLEAGKMRLSEEEFRLADVVADTLKSLATGAYTKELELIADIAPNLPETVIGDPLRLRQVLVNLLGNGIKYTEKGEVIVRVEVEEVDKDSALLHFSVADTGIGIPEEMQSAVFEAFEQADTTRTRKYGGTGLGLSIVTNLIDLMQGRIWADSELGFGSTFHFTVRFRLPSERQPRGAMPALQGKRVLVLSTHAAACEVLEKQLNHWGLSPTVRSDLTGASSWLKTQRDFDILLLDAHLGESDAFLLATQVLADSDCQTQPIMMLNCVTRPGDISRCESLGIKSYIMKPIKMPELLLAIELILGLREIEPEATTEEHEFPTRPMQVLVAEDSLVNQKLTVGLLHSRGHQVVVANNGREAVEAIEARDFDLVLMDVQMPQMDGLDATRAIRAAEKRAASNPIPILAMTAHASDADRQRCLAAGMDEYITKPLRSRELFQFIAGVAGGEDEPLTVATESPPSKTDLIDWPEALNAVNGDKELLKEVIEAYLEEAPQLMDAVQQAIQSRSAAELRRAAHTLKGSLRFFGAHVAAEHAFRLETMGKDEQFQNAEESRAQLEEELGLIQPLLDEFVRRS